MKLPICAVFCVAAAISDRSMWDEWHKNDLFIIDSMKNNSFLGYDNVEFGPNYHYHNYSHHTHMSHAHFESKGCEAIL